MINRSRVQFSPTALIDKGQPCSVVEKVTRRLASYWPSVADPKILKWGRGAEDNLSALSSFIANAHNEICALYTERSGLLEKKNLSQYGGGAAALTASPLESATVGHVPV